MSKSTNANVQRDANSRLRFYVELDPTQVPDSVSDLTLNICEGFNDSFGRDIRDQATRATVKLVELDEYIGQAFLGDDRSCPR